MALFVACATVPTPELRNQAEPPKPVAPDHSVAERLSQLAVTDADFYRPVLYTWTPTASIAQLRVTRQLLVATTRSGGFISPFNRALAAVSARGNPLATVLFTDPQLARRRYAWPAPFATALALGPRSYGNALIRIELKSDAWIGRFEPALAEPFSFRDATDQVIPNSEVVAHPERIGAVFHVRNDTPVAFREYVVCNPAMVASWSVATDEIKAEIAAERGLVADLSDAPWTPAELAGWRDALAFFSDRYVPTPAALAELAAALRAYDPAGQALTVE